ncbi:MAG: hypothetical protein ACREQ9_12950 [Candidatus Binatia bacterium]
MRTVVGALVAIAALTAPGGALAFEVRPEASARGWFFGVDGEIEDTDLDALDFDSPEGQPEFHGGATLGGRHHLDVSYLLIRRSERGTATAVVLGVIAMDQEVSIDLDVDYLRWHYGYSLFANRWIDLQPFLEIGYLREETDIRNEDTGDSSHQEDSAVFPLPGAEVIVAPSWPVRLRGRATGIGTGQGHLIDVEGGLEAGYGYVFGGVGYRHIDFRVDDDGGDEVADLTLDGVYIEGGIRF